MGGKGPAFEREVSSKLSLWFTDDERDDIFYRTGGSGGRATSRRKRGKTTEGHSADISYTDPIGKPLIDAWNIECKTGYSTKTKTKKGTKITNWGILDIIDSRSKSPMFLQLWRDCLEDAEATLRQPVLIFRRPQREVCICITSSLLNDLKCYFGFIIGMKEVYVDYGKEQLAVLRLSDFFEWTTSPQGFF